jgi:hypothetical protein
VVGSSPAAPNEPGAREDPKELIVKALLLRTTAVTLILVLLGSAPAQAHERTASTRITLNANKSVVDHGEKVKFRGRLHSQWAKCRKWQPVVLLRNGNSVGAKKTMKNGKFQFTKSVQNTSNWRVTYAGKRWGKHPHDHRCLGSGSGTIHIRVRGGGGGGGNAVADAGGGSGGTTVVAGVGGAGDTAVLAAGGASALTGSDFIRPVGAAIALAAIGLVAAVLTRRRDRATPPPAPRATP